MIISRELCRISLQLSQGKEWTSLQAVELSKYSLTFLVLHPNPKRIHTQAHAHQHQLQTTWISQKSFVLFGSIRITAIQELVWVGAAWRTGGMGSKHQFGMKLNAENSVAVEAEVFCRFLLCRASMGCFCSCSKRLLQVSSNRLPLYLSHRPVHRAQIGGSFPEMLVAQHCSTSPGNASETFPAAHHEVKANCTNFRSEFSLSTWQLTFLKLSILLHTEGTKQPLLEPLLSNWNIHSFTMCVLSAHPLCIWIWTNEEVRPCPEAKILPSDCSFVRSVGSVFLAHSETDHAVTYRRSWRPSHAPTPEFC